MKTRNYFTKAKKVKTTGSFNTNFDSVQADEPIDQTIYMEYRKHTSKRTFFMRLTFLFIILNLFLIAKSFSQIITINNAIVTNTTVIKANGGILSNTGTAINNNGTIETTGDFENNTGTPLFGVSAGTVTLTGINQNIGGNSITHFNNLNLQVSGTVSLQYDILTGGNNGSNTGVLSLGSNYLELNSKNITVNNPSANAITRTSGFIVSETDPNAGYGSIKWMLQNNTGNYIFPFGNSASGNYIPVTFEITNAGTGTNGYVSVATYPTQTNINPNNRPLPTGLGSLMSYFGTENAANVLDRWWMMDVGNYTDNPVSSITFSYRDREWDASAGSTNTIAENTLQAQSNNYSQWTPIPTGNINTSANTLTVTAVNSYNPLWTLSGNNTPLPMELLVFDARLNKNSQVDIEWATATEVNNDFFTVEKSLNGVDFEAFVFVNGAGNSSNTIYYTSLDKEPYNGITYYRLKQTDYDGLFSYSEIKAVRMDKISDNDLMVFPNPATESFYIKLDESITHETLMILDLNGKLIMEITGSELLMEGSDVIKVDCSQFSPGMYFVTVPGGQSQKLIIK